jgi:hypothetical protein
MAEKHCHLILFPYTMPWWKSRNQVILRVDEILNAESAEPKSLEQSVETLLNIVHGQNEWSKTIYQMDGKLWRDRMKTSQHGSDFWENGQCSNHVKQLHGSLTKTIHEFTAPGGP